MGTVSVKWGQKIAVVPAKFAHLLLGGTPPGTLAGRELAQRDRIFGRLASGHALVAAGTQTELDALCDYVERRTGEVRGPAGRGRRAAAAFPADLLLVEAVSGGFPGIQPELRLPYLAELVGETVSPPAGAALLVPWKRLRRLRQALAVQWPVNALENWLVAGEDVFAPKSQETYNLFRQALESLQGELPARAAVLDLGCGCGVLALIAARVRAGIGGQVWACDLMPEAVASTRLNVERLEAAGTLPEGAVQVLPAGDLFTPAGSRKFHLVVFNAPWVVAPVRSRVELASNDPGQETLRRFFREVPRHLGDKGAVVLGYADNSGARAVERAKDLAGEAGLTITREYSARVQSHRKRRKWQRLYVWVLRRS